MELAIKVSNLSKSFKFYDGRPASIKSFLISTITGQVFKVKHNSFTVLDNISFDIRPGESVGIMGRNGSGKTTLLRILCGIYGPSSGTITVTGKVAPLVSLGAGFQGDLSGYENIYLNAAVLGFGKTNTEKLIEQIIAYSELGDKIYHQVKNYSSGMIVRLGFSIACHLDAPIILLDEILGVGDIGFQRKSLNTIEQMYNSGRTILLVTHSPDALRKYCKRAIILEKGKIAFDGPSEEGAAIYEKMY